MKKRILFIFTLFQLSAFGQLNVSFNWPVDSNAVYGNFYESKSHTIYVGMKNQFRITIPEARTRNIDLGIDTSNLKIKTIWRPIIEGKEWNEPLSEYTLTTAKDQGAYHPEKTINSEKYLDTNGVYWEKEYSLTTNAAQEINITVYKSFNDSTAELYNTIKLYSLHIPRPNLSISSVKELQASQVLKPEVDSDFRKADDYYGIKKFTFTTYGKKDNILFTQTCYGDYLTPEMLSSLNHKKLDYVMLTEIESAKHNYDDLKILNDL